MKQIYTINKNDIDQLINTLNETGVTSEHIGIELNALYDLQTKQDIEKYLVEYLVGFGVIKLEEDQQLTYKDFDLTEAYEDAYFRCIEEECE